MLTLCQIKEISLAVFIAERFILPRGFIAKAYLRSLLKGGFAVDFKPSVGVAVYNCILLKVKADIVKPVLGDVYFPGYFLSR